MAASSSSSSPSSPDTKDWLICTACGTQFPTADSTQLTTCFICDDPRQFTPPTGQSFTTLRALLSPSPSSPPGPYQNHFVPYEHDDRITFIHTTPKVGIGQRCALLRTPHGANILWDCVTLLDEATVREIRARGGLAAIVISHPHYYSTHLLWARAFGCRVYLAEQDRGWLAQRDEERQVFLFGAGAGGEGATEVDIPVVVGGSQTDSGVKALRLGGHFPGSMVLLFDGRLLVADTLVTTPAGLGRWAPPLTSTSTSTSTPTSGRPPGMNSFVFMWSIPNMIPLPPDDIAAMWEVLHKYTFRSTHGAFMGQDIDDEDAEGKEGQGEVRRRVLESMKIQVRAMGWPGHRLLGVEA